MYDDAHIIRHGARPRVEVYNASSPPRENLLNHVRKNVGYFLFICEKIYTILRYNEGPLQLQSCVYKKNKGTIECINLSNYVNLK